MRKRIFISILFFLSGQVCLSQEILKGVFKVNEVLNQHLTYSKTEKENFISFLDRMDIDLVERYLAKLGEAEWEQAEKLLKRDPQLSAMPERAVASFYNLRKVKEAGLLDLHCLTLERGKTTEGTIAVYVTAEQLQALRPSIEEKTLSLEVLFVREIPLTKLQIYKLTR